MNSPWVKLALRFTAAGLVVVAGIRLGIDIFSSFQTETHANLDGGASIDHVFAINSVTIMMGLVGILLFALSFLAPRKRV
jgi:hypothetical protein